MNHKNKLIRKRKLNSPVVEQTPIMWKGTLFLVESWYERWDKDPSSKGVYIRIRNEENDHIVIKMMHGFLYASAFVKDDTIYVFGAEKNTASQAIFMSSSSNMTDWTKPQLIVSPDKNEKLFNQSVCYDGKNFIMAYENDSYVKFTIKFAISNDLENWRKVDNAIYGAERYSACPAIRYVDEYYYMFYLEYLTPKWSFAAYITRSKDLITWESPVLALSPDPEMSLHQDCPAHGDLKKSKEHLFTPEDLDSSQEQQIMLCPSNGKECNASDIDLIEWKGKTRVYFTGGCQHWGGDLQMAEFDGSLKEFLQGYFPVKDE